MTTKPERAPEIVGLARDVFIEFVRKANLMTSTPIERQFWRDIATDSLAAAEEFFSVTDGKPQP